MEIKQLRGFLAVCSEGSFIDAAWTLGISQPALSRQIKELEKELGVELFIRGNRAKGLELTTQGRQLYRRAIDIAGLVDRTLEDFRAAEESLAGVLSIGAGESAGFDIIARAVTRMRVLHPAVRCHIISANASQIYEGLDNGTLDFGFMLGATNAQRYQNLDVNHSDRWGVIIPANHPLAKKRAIKSKDLEDYPLIISSQEVEQHGGLIGWLHKPIEDFTIAAQYNLIGNVYALIHAGLGIALALENLPNMDPALRFIPCEPRVELRASLMWKSHGSLSPLAVEFLRILREEILAG